MHLSIYQIIFMKRICIYICFVGEYGELIAAGNALIILN